VVYSLAIIPSALLLEHDKRPLCHPDHVTLSPAEDCEVTMTSKGGFIFAAAKELPWSLEPKVLFCVKGSADWPDWFSHDGDESLAVALDYAMEYGKDSEFDMGHNLRSALSELKACDTPPTPEDKSVMLKIALDTLETFIECTDDEDSPVWDGFRAANIVGLFKMYRSCSVTHCSFVGERTRSFALFGTSHF
jgi:hypothetical protein